MDLDGLPSFRTTSHALHFTVRLRGNQIGSVFQANLANVVPAPSPLLSAFTTSPIQPDSRFQDPGSSIYCYPWAEVAYFLSPQPTTGPQDLADPTNNGGTPLYALYRRQRLAVLDDLAIKNGVTDNTNGNGVTSTTGYDDVSCFTFQDPTSNPYVYFNSPADLTVPDWRLGGANSAYGPLNVGGNPNADVLLNDVLSFDVRLLLAGAVEFTDLYNNLDSTGAGPSPPLDSNGSKITDYAGTNPLFPFTGTTGPRVFDTWSSRKQDQPPVPPGPSLPAIDYSGWATGGTNQSIPLYQNGAGKQIRIRAIQITIRVWSFKAQQTRQVTIVQDL
jgi:hypothetical protein